MSDESAKLEFDGLAMRVKIRNTKVNEGSCQKHEVETARCTSDF